jgi:hypothetical protein
MNSVLDRPTSERLAKCPRRFPSFLQRHLSQSRMNLRTACNRPVNTG